MSNLIILIFLAQILSKNRQLLKTPVQQSRAVRTHPLLRHRCVHPPEVDGGVDIAFGIQAGEVRRLAVMAAFHRLANQIHMVGGAVVCAQAGVLGGAATKLGIHHQRHVFVAAYALHVLHETGDAV